MVLRSGTRPGSDSSDRAPIQWHHGRPFVRVRLPTGKRQRFWLDRNLAPTELAKQAAEVRARILSGQYSSEPEPTPKAHPKPARAAPGSPGETVAQYVDRWFRDRERRGLTGISSDRGRLRNHVLP